MISWQARLRRWVGRFLAWRRCAAERRYLASLSDYHLKDIGLSRSDAMDDSTNSYWRP